MSPAKSKSYQVTLTTWEVYVKIIKAESEEQAIEKAYELWDESGDESFSVKDGGFDDATAEVLP